MQSAAFLRIGTRGSPLAMAQALLVRRLLAEAHEVPEDDIAIEAIATSGDRLKEAPLAEVGGKGLFSKEIEAALLAGTIDVGVHSSKDMATTLPDGLILPVFLEREDIRDAFVSLSAASLDDLPRGARFGTSSIRRAAQVKRHRPDLAVVPFRGNVDTRLKKLAEGIADATLLAVAGLNRLGKADRITAYLDPDRFPPAPAQGAIGIECRADDTGTLERIRPLDHAPTAIAVAAERALLRALDGSCRTAIGTRTLLDAETLTLRAEVLAPDGSEWVDGTLSGPRAEAARIGSELGQSLRDKAGPLLAASWA